MPQKRSKSLEIARNRSNLASADVTLRLRLGFWPVKSGQCYNVLPIVSVVGPNYQFQLLPTLSSMFSESLSRVRLAAAARGRDQVHAAGRPVRGRLPAVAHRDVVPSALCADAGGRRRSEARCRREALCRARVHESVRPVYNY